MPFHVQVAINYLFNVLGTVMNKNETHFSTIYLFFIKGHNFCVSVPPSPCILSISQDTIVKPHIVY